MAAVEVPCVGALVYDEAGRLLVIQRLRPPHVGSWTLPGGRVEAGETAVEAVIREVREETGLDVEVQRLVGRVERDGPGGVRYLIDDFVCSTSGGTLRAGDDAGDARFVDRAGLGGLLLTPGLVEALTEWAVLPA